MDGEIIYWKLWLIQKLILIFLTKNYPQILQIIFKNITKAKRHNKTHLFYSARQKGLTKISTWLALFSPLCFLAVCIDMRHISLQVIYTRCNRRKRHNAHNRVAQNMIFAKIRNYRLQEHYHRAYHLAYGFKFAPDICGNNLSAVCKIFFQSFQSPCAMYIRFQIPFVSCHQNRKRSQFHIFRNDFFHFAKNLTVRNDQTRFCTQFLQGIF